MNASLTSEERDALAQQVFLNFTAADVHDLDRRVLAMFYIDDEMYDWIRRLELWSKWNASKHFRARSYIVNLNLLWFTLTGLMRRKGSPKEWSKNPIGAKDTVAIVVLVKEFEGAFHYLHYLGLPE